MGTLCSKSLCVAATAIKTAPSQVQQKAFSKWAVGHHITHRSAQFDAQRIRPCSAPAKHVCLELKESAPVLSSFIIVAGEPRHHR